ncbi:MAG: fasciclin domain-containing protein [Opitutales bacterium]|nr:fasciclin domain-containing protein [Opitutales bacterium]
MKKNILTTLAVFGTAVSLPAQQSAFDDLTGDNGVFTNWIGSFTFTTELEDGEAWIEHLEHGPLRLYTEGQNVWLFDANLRNATGLPGWIYTNREFHPYFFVMEYPNNWLLYLDGVPGPSASPRIFADIVAGTSVLLPNAPLSNIAETADAAGGFESLLAALDAAGLSTTIATGGPFTVFAPMDDAFAQIDSETLNTLLTEDTETLAQILLYHVIDESLTSANLLLSADGVFRGQQVDYFLPTLAGIDIALQVTPFGIIINGSSMVTAADIQTSNGVIHVINEVILPPGTVVDLATDGGFSTLVDLVAAAGLAETLSGDGPFTVFAPTEEAFAALDPETVSFLLSEEGLDTLVDILTYHVIGGKVYASEVPVGESVETLSGDSVTFSAGAMGGLRINSASIVATNIVGSNGVIHVIDEVIMPPAMGATSFDIGFDAGAFNYTVNGTTGADITMRRGVTYTFTRTAFGGHPFTLSTAAPGTSWSESDRYGNTPNLTAEGETIVYTPDASTPATLYYRCTVHAPMGGTITVID